ncbi:DUF2339 domain-containing protein [Ramlibacter solisilvae]|uniref:DUF2339 domain-containing protein n=1 Tax=Ramlibacter tataouinensis TaxID=94132 RepID=UPI0007771075|nr:DUF2339 domain-containing protein [Ramlibacter tataouinensis]
MVIWGAVCGAVLFALFMRGGDWTEHLFIGALAGAIAGLTLRNAIRKELRKALDGRALAAPPPLPQTQAAGAVTPPQPVVPAATAPPAAGPEPEFADTSPEAPPLPREAPAAAAKPALPARPDLVTVLAGKARDWLLGGNTVVRVGVLILFVGLAFLAKFAIDNALLPPQLRLAAIGAAGIALFGAGFRLRRKTGFRSGYAMTLQGAGIAVLYLTVFAAFRLYQYLPSGAAFAALALICAFSAVIAVAQNAQALAFTGFAGAFAAPILVSTGQGSHVALFSYYLVLGVAIAGVAWARAWRALNLLGFIATFAVATAWGVLRYQPQDFASTEPFLIAFYAVYLAASLLYALRHSLASTRAVDATMIFGLPLIGFGLQAALVRDYEFGAALSALALGALYLALTGWLLRSRRADPTVRQWLAECFFALGLGFTTLAVPLALDARWTSAVWAVEGAGVFWMGRRQGRWLARAAGLLLQALAAFAFLQSQAWERSAAWPLAHPAFIGGTMLAAAALFLAWQSRVPAAVPRPGMDAALMAFESRLSPGLFWIGFLWWQFALQGEIRRFTIDPQGLPVPVFGAGARLHLSMLAWMVSAFALHHLGLAARRQPWPIAATPAWAGLPVMFAAAIAGALVMNHVFESGGWIAWPLALALHLVMLRRLDRGAPAGWWTGVHAGGAWLLVLLAGNLLVFAVDRGQLWQTAWASVILLVAAILVLLLLSRKAWFREPQAHWPLERFARAYLWLAAAPLAAVVALGSLLVALHSDGNARPLPYIPLLNPTDLAVALGLAACAAWLARIRASSLAVAAAARGRAVMLVLAALAFIAVNTVWLRIAHHFAGVAWDAQALFDSFLVQAGYSILWTLIAVVLMVGAHRRALRPAWMLGAGLLALTVFKLFVIDLSNRIGSERIVVFIAVGLLMLVVGYFAPMPPARPPGRGERLQEAAP